MAEGYPLRPWWSRRYHGGMQLAPIEARRLARELVRGLRAAAPALLDFQGADLGPALEQRLYFALRDGSPAPRRLEALIDLAGGLARIAGAAAASLLPRRRRDPGEGPLVALIRQVVRVRALRPIEDELRRLGGSPLRLVTVSRAASEPVHHEFAVPLRDLLQPGVVPGLLRHLARVTAGVGAATRGWDMVVPDGLAPRLRRVARAELPRVALGAAGIWSLVRRWRPALIVLFDEVGTWSRIVPAVARTAAIPTLDLPHAEANDPQAIAGADLDRMAVFGPRAARVLRAAGIPDERIVEVGSPHYDGLIRRGPAPDDAPGPRRVLFAAQYVQGAMDLAGLEAVHVAALAAAEAVAPCELVVLPHPVEPPGQIAAIAARHAAPAGVAVRVEHDAGLHELLDGTWLMITGWSNSVFEAALCRVPSILVDPGGISPVTYAAEGLGIPAGDGAGAALAARSLLDPAERERTIERARAALADHLGPTDGRASERAARLMLALAHRD